MKLTTISKDQIINDKRLLIVGDSNIGKTTTLHVYLSRQFPDGHYPWVMDPYHVTVKADKKIIILELWDTNGILQFID